MGAKMCNTCDCNKTETVTELDLKGAVRATQQLQFMSASERPTGETISTDRTRESSTARKPKPKTNYADYITEMVKIQAAWRGHQDRKQFVHLKKQAVNSYPYFTSAEIRETLSRYMCPSAHQATPRSRLYKNGGVYNGQWLGGFRHGQGKMTWSDGACYEGNWEYGKPKGFGRFSHIDGEEFEGDWYMATAAPGKLSREDRVQKIQLRDGFSKTYAVWLVYKQEQFKSSPPKRKPPRDKENIVEERVTGPKKDLSERPVDPLEQTRARLISMEKSISDMETRLSKGLKPSGVPGRIVKRLTFPNNNVYEGEVTAADRRDGLGKNTWSNGDVYEGEWKDDMQNGMGRNVWVDGSIYIGQYIQNKKHGIGDYQWDDHSRYVGEWQDDKMHGVGKYSWPDGKYYLGDWAEGVLEGQGEFRWSDGKRYVGPWHLGKKQGVGTTYFPDGRVSKDQWKMGKVVEK